MTTIYGVEGIERINDNLVQLNKNMERIANCMELFVAPYQCLNEKIGEIVTERDNFKEHYLKNLGNKQ